MQRCPSKVRKEEKKKKKTHGMVGLLSPAVLVRLFCALFPFCACPMSPPKASSFFLFANACRDGTVSGMLHYPEEEMILHYEEADALLRRLHFDGSFSFSFYFFSLWQQRRREGINDTKEKHTSHFPSLREKPLCGWRSTGDPSRSS